jgi:hypothetical protein
VGDLFASLASCGFTPKTTGCTLSTPTFSTSRLLTPATAGSPSEVERSASASPSIFCAHCFSLQNAAGIPKDAEIMQFKRPRDSSVTFRPIQIFYPAASFLIREANLRAHPTRSRCPAKCLASRSACVFSLTEIRRMIIAEFLLISIYFSTRHSFPCTFTFSTRTLSPANLTTKATGLPSPGPCAKTGREAPLDSSTNPSDVCQVDVTPCSPSFNFRTKINPRSFGLPWV